MAAPTNWSENPRFSKPRHMHLQQNQTNQYFQRTPQQENSFQQFNPRFQHGSSQQRPFLRHESPNFTIQPHNNMAQNVYNNDFGNTFQHNQRNNNEMSFSQNARPREQMQHNGQPVMISSTLPPPPFPSASHTAPTPFQNDDGRFDAQCCNVSNFGHVHRDDWFNQTRQHNRMEHQQPFNNFNPHDRNNLSFQNNTTFLQPETLQKESNISSIEFEDDQRWLNNWLHNRQQELNAAPKNKPIKMCEAQDKTRHMIVLLARLQKNKQILETVKHEDRSIWEQKLKEVLSIKNELETVQEELTNEENVRHLQARVSQRKKKRERIKQRKRELYEQDNEMLAIRERKHADIDKAMQQIIEKQKLEKQEKDMQKEADEILSQVRKKLTEANRSIQLIDGLQKIRKLRTDRLERQGVLSMYESQGHGSTNRLMFEAKLSNMRDLLNDQLVIYKAEEAALKVHLETEQEETREKEREKTRLRMIERQKQERKKEEKMLFGNQKEPVPGDPLYPFRQYYDAARHSIESLVAIRREWDSYLTAPGVGSYIPDTWVIPEEPASELWGSALKT